MIARHRYRTSKAGREGISIAELFDLPEDYEPGFATIVNFVRVKHRPSFEIPGRPARTQVDRSGEMQTDQDIPAAGLTAETFADCTVVGGLALIEMMRRLPGKDEPARRRARVWIGCHVDYAVVSAVSVTVTRLHTWPDQLFGPSTLRSPPSLLSRKGPAAGGL